MKLKGGPMSLPAIATASLVARVRMSAQETIEGQFCSKILLASSMTSYPRTVWFGIAVFSDVLLLVGSISIEASQP